MLPFHRPFITQDEIDEVVGTLQSGWLTRGEKTEQFENILKDYVGCSYVVAVSSCTAALHLSLLAANIGVGDEVITTPFTFISTISSIIHTGAKPVLVDIDPETGNIDTSLIEAKISKNTKAILPVHFGGHPCDMDAVYVIARKHDLVVIEDAAHAIGAEYAGEKIGGLSSVATCFSFYATKNITTGEGGAIATNDKDVYERVKHMSLHGMTKDAWDRYGNNADWMYDITCFGFKYNTTDIQSAIGIHQMKKIDQMILERKRCAELYTELLKNVDVITVPLTKENVLSAWHLYPLRIQNTEKNRTSTRDMVHDFLRERNIQTSVHFIPACHFDLVKKQLSIDENAFPQAMKFFSEELSLPLYPQLTTEDITHITNVLKEALSVS